MTRTFSSSYKNYYGDMWQYGLGTLITINTIGVFEIVTGMSNFVIDGFTFQNGSELVCVKPGLYSVDWSVCFTDGQIQNWVGSMFVNSTNQPQTSGCVKTGASDEVNMQGHGHIRVEIGDIVTLKIANNTTTNNANINSANLRLARKAR